MLPSDSASNQAHLRNAEHIEFALWACAGAQLRATVQGATSAAVQHLEAHRAAVQAGLADASSLLTVATHTGKQQCGDGGFKDCATSFAVAVLARMSFPRGGASVQL